MKKLRTGTQVLALLCFLFFHSGYLAAQTVLESRMDWTSGRLRISASMPLEEGMAPDSHPRSLAAMERELPALAAGELMRLNWDRRGTLSELCQRTPSARAAVEQLALSLPEKRQWSRLSDDYSRVEALYELDLREAIAEYFPSLPPERLTLPPPGWQPLPEDEWTGVVIYLPGALRLRGADREVRGEMALRARILSDSLEVLYTA